MSKNKIIIFNPRSARWKHRLPNTILQVGASILGKYEFDFVDGNMEYPSWDKVKSLLETGEYGYFASTVMPGPQLKEAIPISKKIREQFPDVKIIWGGYFASNQYEVVLNSGYVDYVINGPGDHAFPELLDYLEKEEGELGNIKNLIYKKGDEIVKTPKALLINPDTIPGLPYEYLNNYYPVEEYLCKTFLGEKTASYHSSIGCPFTCSFCGIVPIFNARWLGQSPEYLHREVMQLKNKYGIDSVEFHDNNFFTSRKRVVEFSKLIMNENLKWWGEGRIDTINKYSDEDLQIMSDAGCRMIFFGAETGNDDVLAQMDKGGTQTADEIRAVAARMKQFNIVPEYSFVLGMPGDDEKKVMHQINKDIEFIKEIKSINPDTEIIIYLYSPVPTEGSDLYDQITKAGFAFPQKLEDWLNPSWEHFDQRRNPLTPWLNAKMINKIQNFETVLNGYYPTASDYRIRGWKKSLLKLVSGWRYKTGFYHFPYEIKLLLKIWKYRQPEEEGFYAE